MREMYYRYLNIPLPPMKSLSSIPAKPGRVIDSEIMEPSVASPRRSPRVPENSEPHVSELPLEGKPSIPLVVESSGDKEVLEQMKSVWKESFQNTTKVPSIGPPALPVSRTNMLCPALITKSVSVGDVGTKPPCLGEEPPIPVVDQPIVNQAPDSSGCVMKRSNSEIFGGKEKEKVAVKEKPIIEEELPPIDTNGLFERLAPTDASPKDVNMSTRAMEIKALEYRTRPQIRSYSRTLYNMAEIEKWISPENPREQYTIYSQGLLGKGAYGEVYCGRSRDKTNTRKYAIKVTPNLFDRPTKIHDLTNEIRFLQECKHVNIVEHIQSFIWNKEVWTVVSFFST
eukprot:TRINITY_DN2510_c0_g2_i7.p1 TRINITY_DN2510_c0_g2~~TRINITY_DN2510_c0_g2_i7.p1  ORF type:complete len:341 (-),score=51.12 TRINITY_DN2510_c0_g2_i7:370-1392(-)